MPKCLRNKKKRLHTTVRIKEGLYRKYPSELISKATSNLDMQGREGTFGVSPESNLSTGNAKGSIDISQMHEWAKAHVRKKTVLKACQDQTVAALLRLHSVGSEELLMFLHRAVIWPQLRFCKNNDRIKWMTVKKGTLPLNVHLTSSTLSARKRKISQLMVNLNP